MDKGSGIQVAGPIQDAHVDAQVRDAKTMIIIRNRVAHAAHLARDTLPARDRRARKGRGRWPSHMPLDSI